MKNNRERKDASFSGLGFRPSMLEVWEGIVSRLIIRFVPRTSVQAECNERMKWVELVMRAARGARSAEGVMNMMKRQEKK